MRIVTSAAALLAGLASVSPSHAGLAVKEIRAYLFFSNSGVLSGNIVGSKKSLFNTIIGEGEAGGAASNVLIDLVLATDGSPSQKEAATLKVTYKAEGKDMTLTRSYDSSAMSANETVHQSVLIENATCWPVTIEARVGKGASKTATIKFGCGE